MFSIGRVSRCSGSGPWRWRTETVPEPVRREVIAQRLPSHDWPDRALRITAIDTATGELVVFDRGSGVQLVDAVAASCAVPGAWPPVTIAGRRYMDGGVASSVNLGVARDCDAAVVLVPSAPTPHRRSATGRPPRSRPSTAPCSRCSPTTTRWRRSGPTCWIRAVASARPWPDVSRVAARRSRRAVPGRLIGG